MHAPARDAGLMDNDAERYCSYNVSPFLANMLVLVVTAVCPPLLTSGLTVNSRSLSSLKINHKNYFKNKIVEHISVYRSIMEQKINKDKFSIIIREMYRIGVVTLSQLRTTRVMVRITQVMVRSTRG